RAAISSPLLETSINGATRIVINVTSSADIGFEEVETACAMVREAAHPDANIIWGVVFDDEMEDELRITVIATGFAEKEQGFSSTFELNKGVIDDDDLGPIFDMFKNK
ncbi:MAG: hypothetical protein RR549_05055, partial [Oscillospiraceae bacterium]